VNTTRLPEAIDVDHRADEMNTDYIGGSGPKLPDKIILATARCADLILATRQSPQPPLPLLR